MTGEELSKLMRDKWLCAELAKHARRYSKRVEDQEEYIQDAWLRIAKEPGGKELHWYSDEGGRQMRRSYQNKRYDVRKQNGYISNGISVTGKEVKKKAKLPRGAIHLYRNKHLDPKPETLDWQFYTGQEAEMLRGAVNSDGWYNKYPDFDTMPRHEQDKVVGRFISRGYSVGMPIGGTPGKKSRHYKVIVDYKVDEHGVVEPTDAPRKPGIVKEWREPAGGPVKAMDLSNWYHLRELGGSVQWCEWLDGMTEELEKRNKRK